MGESQIYHGSAKTEHGMDIDGKPGNLEKARRFLKTINGHRIPRTLSFDEFLEYLYADPRKILRNVFQLFYDMIKTYIGEGVDEYSDDAESIQYIHYDCSRLFVVGVDYPFFADRLFANRLVNLVETLKRSAQQNKIYIFRGPPGSGKSTFLNTLLRKFEEYTQTSEGLALRTVWRIPPQALDVHETGAGCELSLDKPLEIPCPSYDHPILLIPKQYRPEFFKALFDGEPFLEKLFFDKE